MSNVSSPKSIVAGRSALCPLSIPLLSGFLFVEGWLQTQLSAAMVEKNGL